MGSTADGKNVFYFDFALTSVKSSDSDFYFGANISQKLQAFCPGSVKIC